MGKKKKGKTQKIKKTRIPCAQCGKALERLPDGRLYCPKCDKEWIIPEDLQQKLKIDSVFKPVRWLLVMLALLLVVGTVRTLLEGRAGPRLKEDALDLALEERGAKTGVITVSILWDSADDLDLHVYAPGGEDVCAAAPAAGGVLDVESNHSADSFSATPVENLYFASPAAGEYRICLCDNQDRTPESTTTYLLRITAGDHSEVIRGSVDGDGMFQEMTRLLYGVEESEE